VPNFEVLKSRAASENDDTFFRRRKFYSRDVVAALHRVWLSSEDGYQNDRESGERDARFGAGEEGEGN
jgi:hypothetical protein